MITLLPKWQSETTHWLLDCEFIWHSNQQKKRYMYYQHNALAFSSHVPSKLVLASSTLNFHCPWDWPDFFFIPSILSLVYWAFPGCPLYPIKISIKYQKLTKTTSLPIKRLWTPCRKGDWRRIQSGLLSAIARPTITKGSSIKVYQSHRWNLFLFLTISLSLTLTLTLTLALFRLVPLRTNKMFLIETMVSLKQSKFVHDCVTKL